jgi:hypothetical protein
MCIYITDNASYTGLKLTTADSPKIHKRIYIITSGPRPRVAVALSGDGLALNVRLNDIVTFLDVFVLVHPANRGSSVDVTKLR